MALSGPYCAPAVQDQLLPGPVLLRVSLIYKGGREKRDYWPLTVLGADYTVLAKVLANRLKAITPTIISYAQTNAIEGSGDCG